MTLGERRLWILQMRNLGSSIVIVNVEVLLLLKLLLLKLRVGS